MAIDLPWESEEFLATFELRGASKNRCPLLGLGLVSHLDVESGGT